MTCDAHIDNKPNLSPFGLNNYIDNTDVTTSSGISPTNIKSSTKSINDYIDEKNRAIYRSITELQIKNDELIDTVNYLMEKNRLLEKQVVALAKLLK